MRYSALYPFSKLHNSAARRQARSAYPTTNLTVCVYSYDETALEKRTAAAAQSGTGFQPVTRAATLLQRLK